MGQRLMMRSVAAGAALVGGAAFGQEAIYSNGSSMPSVPALVTGSVTSGGVAAPAGALWSEVPGVTGVASNAVGGFSSHLYSAGSSYRFADDFTVPAGRQWRIDELAFFAYQPGAGGAGGSPFGAINVEIWTGPPTVAGSVRVYGDEVTNRLVRSEAMDVYRVFNDGVMPAAVVDTTRRMWRTAASGGGTWLSAGTYWITWQYVPVTEGGVAFSPAVTAAGERTRAGWNGMVLRESGWVPAVDGGKPETAADVAQDFPFVLVGVDACALDYNRDPILNLDDISDFITDFYMNPAIPGGVQAAAPTFADGVVGFGQACPSADDAPLPYATDAYRRYGYRVGYSADGSIACPASAGENFPSLDNLAEYITAYYQAVTGGGC